MLEATYARAATCVDHPTATVSLSATTRTDRLPTRNVIAETKTGRTDRTVVVGAHLDSVPEGPGINDDGSGTATDLEVALQMAKLGVKPVNQVRFIWFSGEEQGLLGSDYYVSQLTKKQVAGTPVMLDFDMLASPNYAELIYDGDGSEFGVSGPNGSGTIEKVFQNFFDAARRVHRADPVRRALRLRRVHRGRHPGRRHLHRRRGAQDAVQQSQAGAAWSSDGLAGQFDPCYHLACDTLPRQHQRHGAVGSCPTPSPTPC